VSRLRRSVVNPSQWRRRLNPTAVYVAFVLDMVALEEVSF